MAVAAASIPFLPADLAPGDNRALGLIRDGLSVDRITSAADPSFPLAYERLWGEFGARQEMESREVIERRLNWQPASRLHVSWMRYEMILVRRHGQFVAVRDHTAIVSQHQGAARAVVHLSHVLVDAASRRTGLTGWLRAWPIQTARACLAEAGFPEDSPITLIAEMEHPEPSQPARMIRLQAYEKAGFLKVDPSRVHYLQPDFRPPSLIDATGGPQPLPFGLVLRRAGRESEPTLQGAEIRELVESLYRMYGTGFRRRDMAVVEESLRNYPGATEIVSLVPPTQ